MVVMFVEKIVKNGDCEMVNIIVINQKTISKQKENKNGKKEINKNNNLCL